MSSSKNDPKQVSRRDFLKTAATGAAIVAGGSILASCTPKQASTATDAADPQAAATSSPSTGSDVMTAAMAAKKWSFEIPPAPIPDNQIANTVTADVIVIGSGVSGLVTANSAVENGAKVVLISASKDVIYRGGSFHAVYSKTMEEQKIDRYDVNQFYRQELACNSFNVDEDKWWKFANNSEEAINWLIDKMKANGFSVCLEIGNTDPDGDYAIMNYPTGSHGFINDKMTRAGLGAQFVAETLAKTAKAAGVQIFFQEIAEQLVRENNNTGRVTAVIAKGADGKYTKYVGTKAIVMAMGDFSGNKEMMAKYCPWVLPLLQDNDKINYDNTFKMGGLYPGDGQKMGLWVGAAWQRAFPNAAMIQGSWICGTQPYGSHRGLLVNKNGYRYSNEDTNGPFGGINQMHQPDMKAYAIWGTNYANDAAPWYSFGMHRGDNPVDPAKIVQGWEKSVQSKTFVKADTIEGVVNALGLPADATKATIDHYNDMCAKGEDTDFHKRKAYMVAIKDGPFYGGEALKPSLLTVLGGLRTDLNMQVCDENDNPIPGLFNVGTMVGDYYANAYTFRIQGNNYGGPCTTFGYMLGRDIAKGKFA